MKMIIEVFDKKIREIVYEESLEKWTNPILPLTEYTDEDTHLRPKTYQQAYTMLINMLNGEIYQNLKYAVRLKDVKHKWDWNLK